MRHPADCDRNAAPGEILPDHLNVEKHVLKVFINEAPRTFFGAAEVRSRLEQVSTRKAGLLEACL